MWSYSEASKRLKVDICLGDDARNQGLPAEEKLLRYLMTRAGELGATHLWCRTRRTESGKVYAPDYMPRLGFESVPAEEQDREEWAAISGLSGGQQEEEREEYVQSLNTWLSGRGCDKYFHAANQWCRDMGAADIVEVADNKEDLADFLEEEHGMTAEERAQLVA
uniref:Uncharacterized protein n=1 Tax=Zooxanthella nutricula TaxID=1333877 RepID=A0A7S2QDM3_9DINO